MPGRVGRRQYYWFRQACRLHPDPLANEHGSDGMGRGIAVEINDILERYRESAVPDDPTGAAEADALAELDAVAIKIDPEQDHELETLLEAARAQVRGRAS